MKIEMKAREDFIFEFLGIKVTGFLIAELVQ
jgi:hypothetical protein